VAVIIKPIGEAQMSVSKTVKIISFILMEFILYLCFLYIDIFDSQYYKISAIIKFAGIVGCFGYAVFILQKKDNPLYTKLVQSALFFTVISDIFLLLTNESEKGVFTFCIVQGIYRYYLWTIHKQIDEKKISLKFLFLPNTIISFLVLFIMYAQSMDITLLFVVTVFYFVSILMNVVVAIRLAIQIKKSYIILFAVGMVLFLFCDINVGIFNISDFLVMDSRIFNKIYRFSTVGMWLFYLPAQVLLAISLSFYKRK